MTTVKRPEYITCILKNGLPRMSLCGRQLGFEFAFVSVEHAKEHEVSGGRLVLCDDCNRTKDSRNAQKAD